MDLRNRLGAGEDRGMAVVDGRREEDGRLW